MNISLLNCIANSFYVNVLHGPKLTQPENWIMSIGTKIFIFFVYREAGFHTPQTNSPMRGVFPARELRRQKVSFRSHSRQRGYPHEKHRKLYKRTPTPSLLFSESPEKQSHAQTVFLFKRVKSSMRKVWRYSDLSAEPHCINRHIQISLVKLYRCTYSPLCFRSFTKFT